MVTYDPRTERRNDGERGAENDGTCSTTVGVLLKKEKESRDTMFEGKVSGPTHTD